MSVAEDSDDWFAVDSSNKKNIGKLTQNFDDNFKQSEPHDIDLDDDVHQNLGNDPDLDDMALPDDDDEDLIEENRFEN